LVLGHDAALFKISGVHSDQSYSLTASGVFVSYQSSLLHCCLAEAELVTDCSDDGVKALPSLPPFHPIILLALIRCKAYRVALLLLLWFCSHIKATPVSSSSFHFRTPSIVTQTLTSNNLVHSTPFFINLRLLNNFFHICLIPPFNFYLQSPHRGD
jgi:hypothetical protein